MLFAILKDKLEDILLIKFNFHLMFSRIIMGCIDIIIMKNRINKPNLEKQLMSKLPPHPKSTRNLGRSQKVAIPSAFRTLKSPIQYQFDEKRA
jgi:hypothetical protein